MSIKMINSDKKIKENINELLNEFNYKIASLNCEISFLKGEINSIKFDKNNGLLEVFYQKESFIYYALHKILASSFNKDFYKTYQKRINNLAFQIDCSRNNVFKISSLKRLVRFLAFMGYDTLYLYLEDTYQIEEDDYFGKFRGRYSFDELKEIISYAKKFDIEVRPAIQTLAHLDTMFKRPKYDKINDNSDILLCENEETYKLIDLMFKNLRKSFLSDVINVGMDEARLLGRGKYLLNNSYKDKKEILYNHLLKVNEIAKKYNFKIEMWSDVFFSTGFDLYNLKEGIKKEVPDNVSLVYWDYYLKSNDELERILKMHFKQTKNIKIAGGAWNWIGFAPNNSYSINQTNKLFKKVVKYKVQDFILTSWNDDGGEANVFLILPTLNYLSNLVYSNKNLNKDFKVMTNLNLSKFLILDEFNIVTKSKDINEYANNFNKFIFYNDLLLGAYDQYVKEFHVELFKSLKNKLKVSKSSLFFSIFDELRELSSLLSLKCKITLNLRKAYKENNLNQLNELVKEISSLIIKYENFYNKFKKMWYIFSKSQGFDVTDLRMGAVILRLKHVKEILNQYINKEINKIDELEEERLDYFGNNKNFKDDLNFIEYNFSNNTSRNLNK